MWDPRYGELATMRLAADRLASAERARCEAGSRSRHPVRRALGARLVSWGERLLAPASVAAQ